MSISQIEKEALIEEIEQRMEQKYADSLARKETGSVLAAPREKWFRDEYDCGGNSLMTQTTGNSVTAWQVWELIRKLTCIACGENYVRNLGHCKEKAEAIAEKLCQTFYDLAMENKKGGRNDVKRR